MNPTQLESIWRRLPKAHTTFADLKIGERFEFAVKTQVGCGKYNRTGRKIATDKYRMECFTGSPSPTVEVVKV